MESSTRLERFYFAKASGAVIIREAGKARSLDPRLDLSQQPAIGFTWGRDGPTPWAMTSAQYGFIMHSVVACSSICRIDGR